MTNEPVHNLYDQLSLANQDVVAMVIRNLAEKEGIEAVETSTLVKPRDGVELWASDLELQGLSRGTALSYKQKVEALLNQYETPNEVDIRTFLTNMIKSEKSKGTASNYIKAFRSFFRYLYDNKMWNANPAIKLKQPKMRYTPRRVPTEAEVRKLIAAIDDEEDLIRVMFMINTGLRVSEMCAIEIADIDLDERRISVIGKGNKQRYIYINSKFFEIFAPYVVVARENDQKWLFPAERSDNSKGHLHRSAIAGLLKRYSDKAKIEHISPHQLRHFFATFILSRGGDVKAVSEFLGHADVTITLKIYHHIGERSMRDIVERLAPAAQDHLRLPVGTIEGEYKEIDE